MVGTIINGRYEVTKLIGRGGMADVYMARCRVLNRWVAVKVLKEEFQHDKELIRRFEIEAQAAASLNHPNIVSVYDVGTTDGVQYIVMELVEGITLKEYLLTHRNLDTKQAIDFSLQIAKALEHAHSKMIIHRDIKPHNIIMAPNNTLKVTDFGIARAASSNTTLVASTAIGSVHYASPEQTRGGYTDERSDIYSLGVVMYEMFTGQLPFDGDTPVAVGIAHLQKTALPPRRLQPDLSPSIEAIIIKSMKKEKRERFLNAAELIESLQQLNSNPDAVISTAPSDISPGGVSQKTKKPPENKVNIQPDYDEQEEKPSHGLKKADVIAISAAVVVCIIFLGFLGFALFRIFAPVEVPTVIPNLLNDSVEHARFVNRAFTITEQTPEYHDTIPAGRIISQQPQPNEPAGQVREISVVVSLGVQKVELEDYTKMDYREAEGRLRSAGLNFEILETVDNNMPEGIVIRQQPQKDASVALGSTVILYVNKGREKQTATVPPLIGLSRDEAVRDLNRNSLVIGSTRQRYSNQPVGTVIEQSPEAGEEIAVQKPVDIVISNGTGTNNEPTVAPTKPPVEKDIPLSLPDIEGDITVLIKAEGETLYNAVHNSSQKSLTVPIKASGKKDLEIYYNNVYNATISVDFSQ